MKLEKHFRLFLVLIMIGGFLLGYIIGEATITPMVEDTEPKAYELIEEIHRINEENNK